MSVKHSGIHLTSGVCGIRALETEAAENAGWRQCRSAQADTVSLRVVEDSQVPRNPSQPREAFLGEIDKLILKFLWTGCQALGEERVRGPPEVDCKLPVSSVNQEGWSQCGVNQWGRIECSGIL